MIKMFSDFKFYRTYELCQFIKDIVNKKYEYPDIGLPKISLLKIPQKESLLHSFIKETLIESAQYQIDKLGGEVVLNQEYFNTFEKYGIKYYSFDVWKKISDCEDNDLDIEYTKYLYDIFENNCLDNIVSEVFHVLFGDREFLKEFNLLVANNIKQLKIENHPQILERDGVLKRPNKWSPWVEKAIKYRDKGRCVLCGCVLTGVIDPSVEKQIDHIVSLNEGGSNDITNLQYCCKKCNIEKLDSTLTSQNYIPYF